MPASEERESDVGDPPDSGYGWRGEFCGFPAHRAIMRAQDGVPGIWLFG